MITEEMIEAGCAAHYKWFSSWSTSEEQRIIARAEMRRILTAALSASPAGVAKPLETVRHKKRGTTYEVIGIGKMQSENWRELVGEQQLIEGEEVGTAVDMREVTIYRSTDDSQIWVRPVEEFNDGRFEPARIMSAIEPAGVGGVAEAPETHLAGEPVAWRYRHVPIVGWSYSDSKHPREDLEQEPLYGPETVGLLREALARMENCCERLAATRSMEVYGAMIDSGQAQALLDLDNARRNARAVLATTEGK